MLRLFKYTLKNAPWALITSLSKGLSTYVIILLLSKFYGLATAGQFRLLLSIVGILSLFTLLDTNKVAIKYLVMGKRGIIRPLMLNQMRWGLMGTVAGVLTALTFYYKGNELWPSILAVSLLLPLTFPTRLHGQILQARKDFRLLAIWNVIKFAVLTLLAVAIAYYQFDIAIFFIGYFAIMTAFHCFYMSRFDEAYETAAPDSDKYVKESVFLSSTGLFPILLEHSDKFLISYFFGLEALGLYTIGVSTGRLFLHFTKPVLTIFYPVLVNKKFDALVLLGIFAVLTLIGGTAAYFTEYYYIYILQGSFMDAYPLSAIILAGLGVYFTGIISYYSAVYHKDGSMKVPVITNVITTILMMIYLLMSVLWGGEHALLLCAASYPLREGVNLIVITFLKRVLVPQPDPSPS